MVRLIGIPGDKDNGSDLPASWINPKHIVHDVPLIDGPADAKRLIVEINPVGQSILRAHFGTYDYLGEVDARTKPSYNPTPRGPIGQ
jgi:hypothetical protein